MYYFYSIRHRLSDITCLGISQSNPVTTTGFKSYERNWKTHLRGFGDASELLEITIMHTADNIKTMRAWRSHYYRLWDVPNNPKFIHSFIRHKNYKRNNSTISEYMKNHPMRWYTDGYNSIFVPENTQPLNYKLGRVINYEIKHTEESKAKISKVNSRAVISPAGERFESIRKAAIVYKCKPSNISQMIKRGISGWRYDDSKEPLSDIDNIGDDNDI